MTALYDAHPAQVSVWDVDAAILARLLPSGSICRVLELDSFQALSTVAGVNVHVSAVREHTRPCLVTSLS